MRPRTQTTRTNHLGYDVGASRKIPDGALARAAIAECLEANKRNEFTRFALTLFRLLCCGFGVVKAALMAAAAIITTRPTDRGGAPPILFQLQVMVEGATVMLDAGSAWTAADVKAALHAKTGRASDGCYLVARGGKPLDDGAATTLAALGVGPGDRLELRGRLRGGMGCGASKGLAGPAPGTGKMVKARAAAGAVERAAAEHAAAGEAAVEVAAAAEVAAATAAVEKAAEESLPPPAPQQAEPAKEAELPAPPELKSSYWDAVGYHKPNASVLKRALADTVLVDAGWLARLADAGDILPRCQDLPEGARVKLWEMERWKNSFTVGVLVISYPWLDADHPDKDGLQLRAISHVLKIFDKEAKGVYGDSCKVGVFLDYVSMPQRSRGSAEDDRTPEEKATFDRALKAINRWYAHPKTHVLLVDTELPAGAHTNMQPYAGRGWCVMECNASGLVKGEMALISLKGLTGKERTLGQVRANGKAARAPPVAPAPFASTLEAGVASGATTFTNRGDVPVVAKIYGWAFAAEMAAVVALWYPDLGWDDVQMLTVCEALRAAHAGGGLRNLERLVLTKNQMGDGAAVALAALLEEGAMPNLKWLILYNNRIADDGVAALASALRGGALPECKEINLRNNPGSDDLVKEALASPERAAVTQNASHMAVVGVLSYKDRGWDDAQVLTVCAALRAAHADGGLRKLEKLNLAGNQMGDGAAAALAALLEEGAMPNLKVLVLANNQIADDGVAALASALRGGALPACAGILLDGNPGSDAKDRDDVDSKVKEALTSPERAAALSRRQAE